MFVAQGSMPDPESIRAIVLLVTAGAVMFWRIAIRLVVIAAILLVVLGALTVVQSLH